MRKPAKPWYREFNDTWYICKDGQQHALAKGKDNEAEALKAFYRLMADGVAPQPNARAVANLFDFFLDHAKRHTKPSTFEWYQHFLQRFVTDHGRLPVASLKPYHVSRWLDRQQHWEAGTRWGAITAIKRACNWAVDEGYIDESPLRRLKKPEPRARERFLTATERQRIRAAYRTTDPWLHFLTALEESGARPGEIARVTATHVDLEAGLWRFPKEEHKTGRKTKKPRVIILTPTLLELTRKLVQEHPTGPIFRNKQGNPWSRNAVRCWFRYIREKLGLGDDVVAYLYRHAYVTNALTNGVPIASVAELVGHVDTKMVSAHYSKLHEQREHLRQMALKATGRASGA